MTEEQWLKQLQDKNSVLGKVIRDNADAEAREESIEIPLQRLKFALRQEKIRPGRPTDTWFGGRGFRIAAAVLVLVGSGLLLRAQWPVVSEGTDESVMRGARQDIVRSPSVSQSAAALAEQLRASGAKVSLQGNAEKTVLSVQFLRAPSPEAVRALESLAIAAPSDGRLLIVFIP